MSAAAGAGATRVMSARYRWTALAILTFAQLCHAMDRSVIALVLEPVRQEFALSDRQLGLLAGLAYGLAFACAAIPLGIAADRFERRKLLAAAVAVWSGFTVLCGFTGSYLGLIACRAAVGAAEAGATPTGLSLIGDYFRAGERSTAIGIWYMSAGLGAMAAFLGGGAVVQHYGWRMGFVAAGLPGLLVALVVIVGLVEPARGGADVPRPAVKAGSFVARFGRIAAEPGLLHCMAGIVLAAITLSGLSSWLVAFFMRAHGLDVAQSGVIVALGFGLLASIGGSLTGILVDRLNRDADPRLPARAAALTTIATVVLTGGALAAGSTPVAIGLLLLGGFCATAYNGPANGLLITLAPLASRAFAVSIVQFLCNLVGMGIGPLIVGTISEAVGPQDGLRWGLAAILLFNLWGAGHFLLLGRRIAARPVQR